MFPTNGTYHITIRTARPREKDHAIIVAAKNMLKIASILVTRPISRRPRRSTQLVWEVMDTAVDAMADTKVAARILEMITRKGI